MKILILILIAYFFGSFLYTSSLRLVYPYSLEWMEGGQLIHTQRILEGESIYTKPSLDFVPYIYTPLYPFITAGVASFTGLSFFPLRLVSIISVWVTLLFIFLFIKNKTNINFASLIGAGLYLASFQLSGYWLDIGRVDSLFIAFTSISIYFLSLKVSIKNIIISSIFLFLAYFTKQTALLIFIPLAIYLFLSNKKHFFVYSAVFIILAVFSTILMNYTSDGWYYFWNFSFPASHHWNWKYLLSFWTGDLIKPLGISIILILTYIILKNNSEKSEKTQIYFIIIGTFFCSWLTRLHYGGFQNSLMPAYLALAICFGLASDRIYKWLENSDKQKESGIKSILLLMIAFQFITLISNPKKAIPTDDDRRSGDSMLGIIKEFKGDIWIPCHPELNLFAGKKSFAHAMLIYDMQISNSTLKHELIKEIEDSFMNRKFDAVILNSDWEKEKIPYLNMYFSLDKYLFDANNSFFTVIGKTRPDLLYLPK